MIAVIHLTGWQLAGVVVGAIAVGYGLAMLILMLAFWRMRR